jgi:hypothetical protein
MFTRPNAIAGLSDTALPATLVDGQSAHVYMSYGDIAVALLDSKNTRRLKLTPMCEDSTGRTYRGEPWDVDPQEFLKM